MEVDNEDERFSMLDSKVLKLRRLSREFNTCFHLVNFCQLYSLICIQNVV